MKQNSFYTIQGCQRGLVRTKEYWQTESYRDRNQSILSYYMNKRDNKPPYKTLNYIREMIFSITPDVRIQDLIKLVAVIRDNFVIDCFQISIDRKKQQAHLLFDFMNRETLTTVQINQSNYTNLQVLIIRHLNLPIPEEMKEKWSYLSIRSIYNEDPDIFKHVLEECAHLKMGKFYYSFIRDMADFTGMRIKNVIDRTLKIY